MAIDKVKLLEKMKGLTPEDRLIFREVLQETDGEGFLSIEEVSTVREMLEKKKTKKGKGLLDTIDSLFD